MPQPLLVFGSTGLVGQALLAEARQRGFDIVGAARTGADRAIDLADKDSIATLIDAVRPAHVLNAAAIVSIDLCEKDPGAAYMINARAVALMGEACRRQKIPLLQISTDHFFTGDGDRLHDENAPVQLVNEYARSKFAGEAFALAVPKALVIRTNVTGLRGWKDRPTFFEWAAQSLRQRSPLSVYDDFYTSTVDAGTLARAAMDLMGKGATGILNVASSDVAHKKRFIEMLAKAMNIAFDWGTVASVAALPVRRAESAGLDVSRAERILGYRLPDCATVTSTLAADWRHHHAL